MTGKQDGWYSQPNEEVQIDFQEEMNPYEYAYWLADKIPAYGDYTKEAAQVLQRQADEIERLQQRIAELEQRGEPVAWRYISRVSKKADYIYRTTKCDWADSGTGLWAETPLYLAAPSPEEPSSPC